MIAANNKRVAREATISARRLRVLNIAPRFEFQTVLRVWDFVNEPGHLVPGSIERQGVNSPGWTLDDSEERKAGNKPRTRRRTDLFMNTTYRIRSEATLIQLKQLSSLHGSSVEVAPTPIGHFGQRGRRWSRSRFQRRQTATRKGNV